MTLNLFDKFVRIWAHALYITCVIVRYITLIVLRLNLELVILYTVEL